MLLKATYALSLRNSGRLFRSPPFLPTATATRLPVARYIRLMGYRSKQIKAAPGAVILSPDTTISATDRLRNAALDVAVLPVLAFNRRSQPDVIGGPVSLHYGFKRWDWRSERGLELALAARSVSRFAKSDILEVGNVLAFAGISGHTVVDKYEAGAAVINVDIMDYRPERRFGLVVSLSTVEHIGWDEEPREPGKAAAAIEVMAGLGEALLVTMPVGYHRELEQSFVNGPFDSVVLAVKTSRLGRWETRPLDEAAKTQYGKPYAFGNGILIGVRGAY